MKMKRSLLLAAAALLMPSMAMAQSFPAKGARPYSVVVPANTTGVLISTGPHVVLSAQLGGIVSAPLWLKFYDKATAPTCGTDDALIVKRLILPASPTAANGGGSNVTLPAAFQVKLGLGYCIGTALPDGSTGAPTANTAVLNIDWN